MKNKIDIKRILCMAMALGHLESNTSTHGMEFLKQQFTGIFHPRGSSDGHVAIASSETGICWVTSVYSMFTNLLTPKIANYIENNKSAMDENEKNILEILTKEVEDLREGKVRKLSNEAKSVVGFDGKKGSQTQAIKVFEPILKKIGLNLNFSVFFAYNDKIIDDVLKKANNVTFFVANTYNGIKAILNHIYCVHTYLNASGQRVWKLANDQGKWLDYNGYIVDLDEKKARKLIKEKCMYIGYFDNQ